MPRIDDILNKISKAKFISKLDLTKGYWQVPLDDDAKRINAFVTPFGHFNFYSYAIWDGDRTGHFC